MLDSGTFRVWIEPLEATFDEQCLHLHAPSSFMAEWLKKHLIIKIREAARAVSGAATPLAIEVDAIMRSERQVSESSAGIVKRVVPDSSTQATLPIKLSAFRQPVAWKYNFDDFVTGPSNTMAVAAARDLCGKGQVHTLYVNAAPGLGKTHLAQAAGHSVTCGGTPVKVGYLTGEQFASRFVAAMRSKELEEFKQKLCNLDVLLFEDVHFLQRKKAMQEMLLGIIKNLEAKGSRVIFTSSFAPRQLQDIDSQLVSHFCSGILASMGRPDIEMRQEILRRKARMFQVNLPDEIADLISRKLSSDIRQLESCLKSMVFKARLLNSGLTVDLALETIGQYAEVESVLDIEEIIRLVCESFGLSKMQLCSRTRRKDYVQGRNTVFYLARKHTDMSLEEIGCIFNRRHSTVMRSITQVEQELARESASGRQIARAVALIERKCGLGNNRL